MGLENPIPLEEVFRHFGCLITEPCRGAAVRIVRARSMFFVEPDKFKYFTNVDCVGRTFFGRLVNSYIVLGDEVVCGGDGIVAVQYRVRVTLNFGAVSGIV